ERRLMAETEMAHRGACLIANHMPTKCLSPGIGVDDSASAIRVAVASATHQEANTTTRSGVVAYLIQSTRPIAAPQRHTMVTARATKAIGERILRNRFMRGLTVSRRQK